MDKTIAVAAFTYSMRNHGLITQIWEKNKTSKDLEDFIDRQTKAEEMKKKIQAMNKDDNTGPVKIKSEPIAAVSRKRRFSKTNRKETRPDKKCRRCGEKYVDGHNAECKANGKTCNECKKVGHLASCCFKKKNAKQNKVNRVQEKDSSIFFIQSISKVSQLEDLGSKIMLDLKINDRKVEALLDTGSPISIMPKKMSKWMLPVERLQLLKEKRFVDINQNPIKMSGRFKVKTTLKNTKGMTVWWEAEDV